MNVNAITIAIFSCELVIFIVLGVYAVIRCQSKKRTFFILFAWALFLFVLGCLLKITNNTYGGVLEAQKVQFIGSSFMAPCYLLFILDFYSFKIKKNFALLLAVIPTMTIGLVWTNEYHNLFIKSIQFINPSQQIVETMGQWYYPHKFFSIACLLVAFLITIFNIRKLRRRKHKQSYLLVVATAIPIISVAMEAFGVVIYGINYLAVFVVITFVLLFVRLMRFSMFDIASQSSDLAASAMSEAFALLDNEQKFVKSNNALNAMFINKIKIGEPVENIENWPPQLCNLDSFTDSFRLVDFEVEESKKYYKASITKISTTENDTLGWSILIRDISETEVLVKKLNAIAYEDSLTGLLSWSRFLELAETAFTNAEHSSEPVSVIVMNLDKYKRVNDTYGYSIGDEILRLVATSIKNILGADDLFARCSGAGFILFVKMDYADAASLALRIKNEVAYSIYEINENSIKCTLRAGTASRGSNVLSLDTLIRMADDALSKTYTN